MNRFTRPIAIAATALAAWGCDALLSPSVYGSLRVQVVRRDGMPIAGVPLTVYLSGRRMVAGATDSNGTYTFHHLPEAEYGVFNELIPGYSRPEIVRPGPRTDFIDGIAVTRGTTAAVQMSLLEIGPGNLVATVIEPGGAGVPGILVTLYTGAAGDARDGVTDAAGTFTFINVPFGDWGVRVVRPAHYRDSGDAPLLFRDALIVDAGGTASASFTFVPCDGTISATVRDDLDTPVPGARVALYHFGQDVDSAAVGDDGAYAFTGLACLDYGIRLSAAPIGWRAIPGRGSSFHDGLFLRRGDQRAVTLRVERVTCRGTLRVTVSDDAGPVPGAELVVYTAGAAYRSAITPANGIAAFPDLPCDRDWGVYVIPPPTHTAGIGAGAGYFDGILLTGGATVDRAFVLTRR